MGAALLACLLLLLVMPGNAGAVLPSNGSPVSSFGGGSGWVADATADPSSMAMSVAVQDDGAFLTGEASAVFMGAAQITRRLANGTLDTSFGVAGRASVVVEADDTSVMALDVDSQGRIVGAGSTYVAGPPRARAGFVVRLLADGTPDSSFGGGDGVALVDVCAGHDDMLHAVRVLADDSIVAGGYASSTCAGAAELSVVKLTEAGALDASFGGGDGIVAEHPTPLTSGAVMSVVEQPDGRLLVAGQNGIGSAGFVARLAADGSYDASFGASATGLVDVAAIRQLAGVHVLADGRVLATGTGVGSTLVSVRLLADGTVDLSYGASGVGRSMGAAAGVLFNAGPWAGNMGSALTSDGSVVVCATSLEMATMMARGIDPTVIRFLPDGTLDAAFGAAAGRALLHTAVDGMGPESTSDCVVDPRGRIMLVGSTDQGPAGTPDPRPLVAALQMNLDFDAPTVTGVTVTATSFAVTLTAHARDGASGSGIEDVIGAWSFDGGATWQAADALSVAGLQPGDVVSRTVLVRDRAGNVSAPFLAQGQATPDTTAPAAAATVDAGYDRWTVTVTASDDVVGLHAQAYSFDGGATWQEQATLVRTGLRPRTADTVSVRVRDRMGNVTALTVAASTLDDGVPTVLPLDRTERSADEGELLTFSRGTRAYEVTNKFGTIVELTARFRGRTVALQDGRLNVRRLREGVGTLTIRAVDSDGDVGVYTRRVRIDRSAPTLRARSSKWVLGPVVKLRATDRVSGVRTGRSTRSGSSSGRRAATLRARVPDRLGSARLTMRVTDAAGNSARRTVRVHRRLALGNQRLNRGVRPVTFRGEHVRPSTSVVHASFRFLGYVPPWYPSHDMQTPFVAEAQWRLVRMGCLAPGAYEAGSLDLPTIRAVQAYQARTRLPVLGTIGPRTRAQLDRDLLAGLPKRCARPARTA